MSAAPPRIDRRTASRAKIGIASIDEQRSFRDDPGRRFARKRAALYPGVNDVTAKHVTVIHAPPAPLSTRAALDLPRL
jgi:hypothetical protein